MERGYYVELGVLIKEFNLQVIRGGPKDEKTRIYKPSINRPGLQLVGFYDYFDNLILRTSFLHIVPAKFYILLLILLKNHKITFLLFFDH